MPFPSTGHPPIPIPTGSSNATFPQQTSFPQHSQQSSTPAVRSKAIPIRAPSNREEGEVSEAADEKSLQPTRRATRQYSDLEEGETVSSSGRSSRRSSGSRIIPLLPLSNFGLLTFRSVQPSFVYFGRPRHHRSRDGGSEACPTSDGIWSSTYQICSAATNSSSRRFA